MYDTREDFQVLLKTQALKVTNIIYILTHFFHFSFNGC